MKIKDQPVLCRHSVHDYLPPLKCSGCWMIRCVACGHYRLMGTKPAAMLQYTETKKKYEEVQNEINSDMV